jgi:hypothetical protein
VVFIMQWTDLRTIQEQLNVTQNALITANSARENLDKRTKDEIADLTAEIVELEKTVSNLETAIEQACNILPQRAPSTNPK